MTSREKPLHILRLGNQIKKPSTINPNDYLSDKWLKIELGEDIDGPFLFPVKPFQAYQFRDDKIKDETSLNFYYMEIFTQKRRGKTYDFTDEKMKRCLDLLKKNRNSPSGLKVYITTDSQTFSKQFLDDFLQNTRKVMENGFSNCMSIPKKKLKELKLKFPEVYKELKEQDPTFNC
jgi:hypothetical protein